MVHHGFLWDFCFAPGNLGVPSLRGWVARRQPRREGFSPTFAVCVRRRFEPLSLLRRQLPSQGSQTAGNIALSHTRPCRENRKQRHCTDSFRPCVLAEIIFSTSCASLFKGLPDCRKSPAKVWFYKAKALPAREGGEASASSGGFFADFFCLRAAAF